MDYLRLESPFLPLNSLTCDHHDIGVFVSLRRIEAHRFICHQVAFSGHYEILPRVMSHSAILQLHLPDWLMVTLRDGPAEALLRGSVSDLSKEDDYDIIDNLGKRCRDPGVGSTSISSSEQANRNYISTTVIEARFSHHAILSLSHTHIHTRTISSRSLSVLLNNEPCRNIGARWERSSLATRCSGTTKTVCSVTALLKLFVLRRPWWSAISSPRSSC